MKAYLDLLRKVLEEGQPREDRTGVGTLSCFGAQLRFDLQKGFPLVTTKKIYLRALIHEGHDLGRMGRPRGQPGPCVRSAMAGMAPPRRQPRGSDQSGD